MQYTRTRHFPVILYPCRYNSCVIPDRARNGESRERELVWGTRNQENDL